MCNDGPVEMSCGHCSKDFWLNAHVTVKYETSTIESFDEDDHKQETTQQEIQP
jgi:hypothetical protein